MTYNSHSYTGDYYLVCDPVTGQVVVRAHFPTTLASLRISHFTQLKVTRAVWNQHRAGEQLNTSLISEPQLGEWLSARLAARKVELVKEATRRALEELDRDNLPTWPVLEA